MKALYVYLLTYYTKLLVMLGGNDVFARTIYYRRSTPLLRNKVKYIKQHELVYYVLGFIKVNNDKETTVSIINSPFISLHKKYDVTQRP